jgi:hypothetical protein
MQRFAMTPDRLHFWLPLSLTPPLLALPLITWFVGEKVGHPAGWIAFGTTLAVALALLVTTLLTPTAVRLTAEGLEVERLAWPAFKVPWSELHAVEAGPRSSFVTGEVWRVAGVGGWTWSGGLFRVRGIGNVRAWLRRLGPTVVVRRAHGLPLLFGPDDPEGLRAALAARLGAA